MTAVRSLLVLALGLSACGDARHDVAVECVAEPQPETWQNGTTVTLFNARLKGESGHPKLTAELHLADGSVYPGVGRVYYENGVARVSCGAEFKKADGTVIDYPADYAVFSVADEGVAQ